MWEVLTNIDGDTAHVNGDFQTPSLMDDYSYTNTNSNPSDDALQAAIAASLGEGGQGAKRRAYSSNAGDENYASLYFCTRRSPFYQSPKYFSPIIQSFSRFASLIAAPNTRAATAASTRIITYGPGHSATVAAMPPNVAVGVSLADKKETTPQPSDEQIAQQLQYQINLEESSRHDEDLARQVRSDAGRMKVAYHSSPTH